MRKFHRIYTNIILLLSLITLNSCDNSRLRSVLELAGENRQELEMVLKHYSIENADSLKCRAAYFLIENLPLHYNYTGTGLDEFEIYYNSNFREKNLPREELIDRVENINIDFTNIYQEFDITHITSNFLIEHIDNAIISAQYPWTKDLTNEDFFEYVLPYRIGNELREDWMPFYREYLAETIRMLIESEADMYIVATTIRDTLKNMDYHVIDGATMKVELKPSDYIKASGGACPEITRILLYALRSVGLPVNYDYIIQWANRNQKHSWNSLMIDSTLYSFGMSDPEFGKHFQTRAHQRMGKVYRKMFSFQHQSLPNQKEVLKEDIPPVFRNTFLKDVSELYFDGVDATLNLTIPIKKKKRLAYLAVFDNRNWVPVAWSKIKRGKVTFENIEKKCAYMVMYYHEGILYPATDPFTVSEEGEIVIKKPDYKKDIAVILKRKYPFFFNKDFFTSRVKNGMFQIADNPYFKGAKTVYITPEVQEIRPYYFQFDDAPTFKYIRYVSAPKGHVFLAEIEFYNKDGVKLNGEIIGTDGSYQNSGNDKYKLFDDNPLTYFNAPEESGCWGGMAFDSLQTLGSIMLLPRNDDNFIQADEYYELFYCHQGEFVSLGQRVGDKTHILKYDNVPDNSMLLLRNLSKGKEERIFTYENGEQVWW